MLNYLNLAASRHTMLIAVRNDATSEQIVLCRQSIPEEASRKNGDLQRNLFVPN